MKLATSVLALASACAPDASVPELVERAVVAAQPQPAVDARRAGYRELVHGRAMAQGVELAAGESSLELVTLERAETSDDYERSEIALDAGFAIRSVASRQAWELLVAGVASNGETVIERWRIQPPHGARTLQGGAARVEGLASGAFIPVAARARTTPRVARTTLLRTRELGGTRLLLADPDGRFVLALAADGEVLVQVATDGESTTLARFAADGLPALRTACTAFAGEHFRDGRVFAFEAPSENGIERALLVDRDADGWFEDVRACDAECWSESGLASTSWLWSTSTSAR